MSFVSCGLNFGDLLAILDDTHLSFDEEVELRPPLALLKHCLVLAEGHLIHRRCQLFFLILLQCRKAVTFAHMLEVFLHFPLVCLHQEVLKLLPGCDPHNGVSSRRDRGSSRGKVQQRQLPEASTGLNDSQGRSCLFSTGGARVLGDFEAARLHNIEVVRLQVTLLDHRFPVRDLLFPHDVNNGVHLVIIQGSNCVQIGIVFQSCRDQLLLGRCLWAGSFDLCSRSSTTTNSASLTKFQLGVEVQFHESIPGDSQSLDICGCCDCGSSWFIS
mmetsp:Transcript_65842/g.157289  ORF Transcript_65842/g.157289 Transcript_65842/m.157289 type:complete len:272 (+) Transcript_65842:1347-2162(+)